MANPHGTMTMTTAIPTPVRFLPEAPSTPVKPPSSDRPHIAPGGSTKPTEPDIRDWDEARFGISANRLRNCIIFQLDYSEDPWFQSRFSQKALNTENFVRKLDADTPIGWSPDMRRSSGSIPKFIAELLMLGPGVNEPLEGWTSARQKLDSIKRNWYGTGWESQPDPDILYEDLFTKSGIRDNDD